MVNVLKRNKNLDCSFYDFLYINFQLSYYCGGLIKDWKKVSNLENSRDWRNAQIPQNKNNLGKPYLKHTTENSGN